MILNTIDATVLADQHWHGPGAWWPVFPLLWFLLIGTAIVLFVRSGRRRGRESGQRAGERRLAERYASGEIDDDEYARRLGTLRGSKGA